MPVGVPKVPFQIPGDEEAGWVDLYNRLYRQRLLFLCDEVDSEISNQIMGLMVFLSMEDRTEDLYLFINSPGGSVISGIAIYDMMHALPPQVQTMALGMAASMGSLILLGGEITRRIASAHSRIMIHQPASSFFESPAGELVLEAEELLKVRESITRAYVQRTGKPLWIVSEDMERDVFMSATEAQAYGIVDLVGIE